MANMIKQGVDDAAKKYWQLLFEEYGSQLVKDVPRRIKAELDKSRKVASSETATLSPVAAAKDGDVTVVEGIFQDGDVSLLFTASVKSDGTVDNVHLLEI